MAKEKKILIIGAGLAGLSAGIYAQMNGYQAKIYEHAHQPGGVAATWKRKGYTIDGGIHFFMGYRPGQPVHDLYRELGVYQADQYQELTTYARFVDPARDRSIEVTQDLDRFGSDVKSISPSDATFIDDFVKAAKAFKDANFVAPMAKPPELTRPWDTVRMLISMWKTVRYYTGRYALPVNQAVKGLSNSWVREVLEHLFLPDVPVWFVLFTLGMLAGRNMALRLDGSAGFARALEKRFTDLGGQISYKAKAEEIVVEGDQAVGVRLAGGEEHCGDRIISAADGYSTIFELLGGRYTTNKIRQIHQQWPLHRPVVLVSYGIARGFHDDPWLVVPRSTRNPSAGHLVDRWWLIRIFNYSPVFAPPGKTVLQVMVDSAWQPWRDLRDDPEAYRAQKKAVAAQVLGNLCDVWPGIADQVEMTDVATPYTFWRHTLNREGAYQGFAITPQTLRGTIRRTLPGLRSFYMAGQWTSPGGGVVPCIMTGRHAVMLLCRQDSRRFETTMV
jgi:phytoene dehydrogenase-like protein